MKNLTTSATGWIVATIALSALVLMGISRPETVPAEEPILSTENFGTEPFIGEITMFAGNFAPRGWALCDGQLLAISGNEALFSLLGTTYGGDGRTTFALPDLRGRVVIHPGSGPGLSTYRLGQKGGAENMTAPEGVPVKVERYGQRKVMPVETPHSNLQPYGTVNYIIALQGVYPSRH